jgi:hypothetical protein
MPYNQTSGKKKKKKAATPNVNNEPLTQQEKEQA